MRFRRWVCLLLCLAGCPALHSAHPRYGRAVISPKPVSRSRPPRRAAQSDPRKGRLPWPVPGTVTGRFGLQLNPKYGTKTRNQGVDIVATPRAPVIAVDSGLVSFADVFRGYGLMVILEHRGGCHSVYAGMSELRVAAGRKVRARDTLGLAADTVHFEFRVGGQSVDPEAWLAPR